MIVINPPSINYALTREMASNAVGAGVVLSELERDFGLQPIEKRNKVTLFDVEELCSAYCAWRAQKRKERP